ncbi:MAG: leucine-rich repeat protein [Muribaculaceae bacterium]|nr:leucine-rich repeat protein [Muribaculaceae bacterium]
MKSNLIIAKFIAVAAGLSAFANAYGAVDFVVDGISYTRLEAPGNAVEVSRPESGYYTEPSVVIPSIVEYDGTEYTVTGIGERAFASSRSMTSLVIPEGITSIGSFSIYNTGITELVIPSTIVSMGNHAINSNEFLKSVTIKAALTEIPDHCFYSCKVLSEINIPETVEIIGQYALGQTQIKEVVMPKVLREIGKNAFQICPSLKSVVFNEGLEAIGERAFSKCTALTELIIPGTVRQWGEGTTYKQSPFENCDGVKRLVFNEGVTEIPAYCIAHQGAGVANLNELVIPSTVTKIGQSAFYGNSPWRPGAKISLYAATPLDYEDKNFTSSNMFKNCTLEVPAGSAEAYRNHSLWGKFENIVERIEYVETPEEFKNTLGEGKSYAGLSIWWGDDKALDNLTEAVRFNGAATVYDIVASALASDSRFYALKTSDGTLVAFGFDTNGDNSAAVTAGGTALTLESGVATCTGDFESAAGSSEYDHWNVNSADSQWKVFVNGQPADFNTAITAGDNISLEYLPADATGPAAKEYTFYLRPADQSGIWTLDEVQLDTATDKNGNSVQRKVPMIANVCGDSANLYGVGISAEVRGLDNTTASSDYSVFVPDARNGAMQLQITANNPVEALIVPYLNIRKDWGAGKQEVKRVFSENSLRVSTAVANPVSGITLKEYAPGDVIELENMGCTLITPQYEPENADFTSFAVSFADESIVTFYSSIKGLVAHRAGETTMTLSVPGTDIKTEYTIKVKDVDPDNKPADDFADGVFWLNEEWFTHTSGSINYISQEGKPYYRVYGNQNNNMAFGATSPFATIYAGKLIVMSKQAWDNGDTREKSGGRVVVADASTLKHIGSIDEIGGDGRACVGVNTEKVYLSHTNGIRVMHIDSEGIHIDDADIEGIDAGRNGQMGDMVKAGKYVFATCVGNSLAIIDTETDKLVENIAISGIQTVAQSLDGRVWIGCAKTLQPIDPETLELGDVLSIGAGTIGCSSSSWRAGNLKASNKTNTLFWSTGNWNGSTGDLIRWDIDQNPDPSELSALYTHGSVPDETYSMGYGSPAYDSRTDTWMYSSTAGFGANAMLNRLHFVDASTGELKHSIELDKYFWFPSTPVMPDKYDPEILLDNIELPAIENCDEEYIYDLNESLDDKDNLNCNITVSIPSTVLADETPSEPAAEISLDGKTLTVKPLANGTQCFTLMAESNGKVVSKNIELKIGKKTTGIGTVESGATIYSNGHFVAFRNLDGVTFDVYALDGRKIDSITISNDATVIYPRYMAGIYIFKGSNGVTSKIRIN